MSAGVVSSKKENPGTKVAPPRLAEMLLLSAEALRSGISAAAPWSAPGAFDKHSLSALASEIERLPMKALPMVKAFAPSNAADAWARDGAHIAWSCLGEDCGRVHAPGTTVLDAVTENAAPLAARLSDSRDGSAATAAIGEWVRTLADTTGRPVLDADAYLTPPRGVSASLGWHVDDVDVLLVMLCGEKRFRVAGSRLGSPTTIDLTMRTGDAIYIPALNFHTGGGDDLSDLARNNHSVLLSVAHRPLPAAAAAAATRHVTEWRTVRQALLARAPSAGWEWAGTRAGAHWLGQQFGDSDSSTARMVRRHLVG